MHSVFTNDVFPKKAYHPKSFRREANRVLKQVKQPENADSNKLTRRIFACISRAVDIPTSQVTTEDRIIHYKLKQIYAQRTPLITKMKSDLHLNNLLDVKI